MSFCFKCEALKKQLTHERSGKTFKIGWKIAQRLVAYYPEALMKGIDMAQHEIIKSLEKTIELGKENLKKLRKDNKERELELSAVIQNILEANK